MLILYFYSLTLSKLSQNRMVEDKVARRRAMQMEKLQKKQTQEQNVNIVLYFMKKMHLFCGSFKSSKIK